MSDCFHHLNSRPCHQGAGPGAGEHACTSCRSSLAGETWEPGIDGFSVSEQYPPFTELAMPAPARKGEASTFPDRRPHPNDQHLEGVRAETSTIVMISRWRLQPPEYALSTCMLSALQPGKAVSRPRPGSWVSASPQ